MLEARLLPVVRTVLGPGEMSYWAQLGPLFEQSGAACPETVARDSWLLVEPKVLRWLGAVGAEPQDVADGGGDVENRLMAGQRPEPVAEALRALRRSVGERLDDLTAASRDELPGLDAALGKAGKAMSDAIREMEKTIDTRVRERRSTSVDRVRRAAALLYPGGERQERVDSVFPFLARYGPGVLEEMFAAHGITGSDGIAPGRVAGPRNAP